MADPRVVADDSGNRVEEKTLTTEIAREGRLGRSAAPVGRGKPWTRGESDRVGEPIQRRHEGARETMMGKGEIKDDADAGALRRLSTLPATATEGQAFPAISDDRPSRRKVV